MPPNERGTIHDFFSSKTKILHFFHGLMYPFKMLDYDILPPPCLLSHQKILLLLFAEDFSTIRL